MPTKAIPTIVGAGVTLAVTDAVLGRRATRTRRKPSRRVQQVKPKITKPKKKGKKR